MLMRWVHSPRLLALVHATGIHSTLPSLEAHSVGGDDGCGHCCRCTTYMCLMGVHTCSYTNATRAQIICNPRKAPWISVASFDQISMFRYDTFRSYHTIVSYDRQIRSYNTIETLSTNWVSSLKSSNLHNFLHTCPFSTKIKSLWSYKNILICCLLCILIIIWNIFISWSKLLWVEHNMIRVLIET